MRLQTILHGTDYYPEQWLEQPEVLQQDMELMQEAGINTVTLGVFAWSMLEPREGHYQLDWLDEVITRLGGVSISTILATPSGARPPWMAHAYPEVLRTREDGQRAIYGGRHNHCPTSPVYREKVAAMNEILAQRFGGRDEVVLWHISNEYQGTCYCPLCATAFRRWLQEEHQDDLELLNRRWWSRFWGHRYTAWDQIEPPMIHGERNLHGQIIDWKRFVSHQISDFARHEVAAIRRHDATTPTTHNLMGLHHSLNYADLVREVDVVSGDIYPAWGLPPGSDDGMLHRIPEDGDVMRNYRFVLAWYRGIARGRPWLLMESTPGTTNWHPVGRLKRPGAHVLSSLAAIAGGAASIQYFQWRQGRGGWEQFHGSVIDHEGNRGRTFREVRDLSAILAQLGDLAGAANAAAADAPPHINPAAVVLDTPNRWMIEQASGPRNDGRRDPVETAMRHYTAVENYGLTADVIPADALQARDTLAARQVIVLPMTAHLPEGTTTALREWVHQGGTLVVTYFSGVFDRWQRLEEGGYPAGLTRLLGIRVEERDQLAAGETVPLQWDGTAPSGAASIGSAAPRGAAPEGSTPEGATPSGAAREYCDILRLEIPELSDPDRNLDEREVEIVARYGGQFYGGTPAITRRSYGKGHAWYLACRLDADALAELYRRVIPDSSTSALPPGVHRMERNGGEYTWEFYFNPTEEAVTWYPRVNRGTPSPILYRGHAGQDGSLTLDSWGSAVVPSSR